MAQGFTLRVENKNSADIPDLSYQVVDVVPSHGAERYCTPPPHQVRRQNIRVRMQMIGDGNFVVLEWRSNESYPEGFGVSDL